MNLNRTYCGYFIGRNYKGKEKWHRAYFLCIEGIQAYAEIHGYQILMIE